MYEKKLSHYSTLLTFLLFLLLFSLFLGYWEEEEKEEGAEEGVEEEEEEGVERCWTWSKETPDWGSRGGGGWILYSPLGLGKYTEDGKWPSFLQEWKMSFTSLFSWMEFLISFE